MNPALAALVKAAREYTAHINAADAWADNGGNEPDWHKIRSWDAALRQAVANLDAEQGAEVEVSNEMYNAFAEAMRRNVGLNINGDSVYGVDAYKAGIAAAMKARKT